MAMLVSIPAPFTDTQHSLNQILQARYQYIFFIKKKSALK